MVGVGHGGVIVRFDMFGPLLRTVGGTLGCGTPDLHRVRSLSEISGLHRPQIEVHRVKSSTYCPIMNLGKGWNLADADARKLRLLEYIADSYTGSNMPPLPEWAQRHNTDEHRLVISDLHESETPI